MLQKLLPACATTGLVLATLLLTGGTGAAIADSKENAVPSSSTVSMSTTSANGIKCWDQQPAANSVIGSGASKSSAADRPISTTKLQALPGRAQTNSGYARHQAELEARAEAAAIFKASMPPAALQNRYVQQWLSQFPEVKNPSARYLQFTRSLSVAPQQKNVTTVNDVIRKTGDYCDEMVAGTAQRWSADRFPLRVYIEPSGGAGFRPSCPNLVEQALSQWTAVSGYRLTFTRSNDAANADIVVSWMPCATATECGNTSTRYVPDRAGNRLITSALVQISTWEQGPISDGELKKICLHELGHALGLKHSSNPLDIMFWQSNRNQICNLGPRDGNTIRRFYGLD